ncbi:MAG: hypothetical protein SVK08_02495 [Halobacteriota archaeon]|nr:hypothetical protein [Halobacteriota archaeon]
MQKNKAIQGAYKRVHQSEDNLRDVIQEQCPVGSRIWYEYYGRGPTKVKVMMHSHGGRIKVHNEETGKEYWIHGFHVCEGIEE